MTHGFRHGVAGLALLATGLAWSGGASAAIVVFSNPAEITIPAVGSEGIATPFPSTIAVTGITNVTDVDVTLRRLRHSYSEDLEIVVEGPTGLRVILLGNVGGAGEWIANDVRFSDGAGLIVVGTSGTYSPQGNGCSFTQCFGAGSLLSVFNGVDPTGAWNLYINDGALGDVGAVYQGWRLTFNADIAGTVPVPEPATLAMLGFGLAGLGLARRRRKAARTV